MNIPLVMTAAPLNENTTYSNYNNNNNSNNNNVSTTQQNTQNKQKVDNNKTNINSLKKVIQDIHNNSLEQDNDLYNSLNNYEPSTQKSEKINYEPPTELQRISNTNSAYNNSQTYTNNLRLDNKDELLQKINYIIYTLDKQKDIKSNQKIEELLLYSFIGVFLIYVLDSFTKIGKYKR